MRKWIRLMVCLLFTAVMFGCGGGGSSSSTSNQSPTTGGSNALLSGTYVMSLFMDDEVPTGGYSLTTLLELTFDGSGNGTFSTLESSVGATDSGSFTYSVAADGTLETEGDKGIVSADGNTFTFVDADPIDDAVAIYVGIKKGTGLSNAILSGTYVMSQFMDDEVSTGGSSDVALIELTFDGSGNGTFSTLESSVGATDSGSFTYSVAADGTLEITNQGDKGIVSADGNSFTFVDADPTDDAVAIYVGIKKGTGLSNAILSGTYVMSQFMDDEVSTGGSSVTTLMELTFDGSGNGTFSTLESSVGATDSGSFTYSVAADGTLEIEGDKGIVSADGNTFTLVDADPTDDAVAIYVGMKKGN